LCEKDQGWERKREREREMGKNLITGTKESLSRTLGDILPCRYVPGICS
jgi:hypothetical protein